MWGVAAAAGCGSGWATAQASLPGASAQPGRCVAVQAAITQRVGTLGQQQATANAALQRLDARLTDLVGRADARGYDIGRLQADQTELEHRAAAIKDDYAALLTATKAAAAQCGATGSLAPARAKLARLRADVAALQTWRQASLAVDLQTLSKASSS